MEQSAVPPLLGGYSARATLAVGCKAGFPMEKILLFKGRAFLIVRQTHVRTNFMLLPLRNTWFLQRPDTSQPISGCKGKASGTQSRYQGRAPSSETPTPSLLPKLSFCFRWNRQTDPSLGFPVCNSHYKPCLSKLPCGSPSRLQQGPGAQPGDIYTKQAFRRVSEYIYMYIFPSPPHLSKCLEYNSACLYRADKQNCLEMEAKPYLPKITGRFYNTNTRKNVGLGVFVVGIFFAVSFFPLQGASFLQDSVPLQKHSSESTSPELPLQELLLQICDKRRIQQGLAHE